MSGGCLEVLRRYVTSDRLHLVVLRDEVIFFGDEAACHRSSPTGYAHGAAGEGTGGTGGGEKNDGSYTLDAVLFCYNNRTLKFAEYVSECRRQGFPSVSYADRRDLFNFLSGETSTSTHLLPPSAASNTVWLNTRTLLPIPTATASAASTPAAASSSSSSSFASSSTSAAAAADLSPPHKRAKTDSYVNDDLLYGGKSASSKDQDEVTKEIMQRERTLRDRKSILLSKGVEFTSVLSLLEDLSSQREPHRRSDPHKPAESVNISINKGGSFLLAQPNPLPSATLGRQPASTSSSAPATSAPLPPPSIPHPIFSPKSKSSNPAAKIPIIIVPAGATSLITILNLKKFLEHEGFMSNQECKDQGIKKENLVVVQRKKDKGVVPYHVIDNITKLKVEDWARVVAVFAVGAQWQFKDWPKDWSFPADHFTNVKGFHLKFDDTPLDANIKSWNVTILQISRSKRHLDGIAVMTFWEQLDKFTAKNKPFLTF